MQIDVHHCKAPWEKTYVHVNGDVKPCCYVRGTFGNVRDVSKLANLTEGAVALELREFVKSNRIHPICARASCGYVRGRGALPDDFRDAVAWAQRPSHVPALPIPEEFGLSPAALESARSGNKDSLFKVGYEHYCREQYPQAITWFEAAAVVRSEFANMMLGQFHHFGLAGLQQNPTRALRYYRAAAAEGHGPAFTMLGMASVWGHNPIDDPAEMFRTAGERGDAEGWYQLALLYRSGSQTVEKNEDQRLRFMKIAASRGHEKAKEELGDAF